MLVRDPKHGVPWLGSVFFELVDILLLTAYL